MTTPTTPEQARQLATNLDSFFGMNAEINALRSLADQVEALTKERDSYKKDAERYAKKYQHYHLGINGRICAVCDFDVTDPIHIRGEKPGIVAAIAKGTA